MGRMARFSIGTTASSIRFDGCRRVIIKVSTDSDVKIAYDIADFDVDRYFTLEAGATYVFDPDPVTGENLLDGLFYAKTDSGTCVVEVWLQSQGSAY